LTTQISRGTKSLQCPSNQFTPVLLRAKARALLLALRLLMVAVAVMLRRKELIPSH
jgi:hypothetical protein